DLGVAEAAGGNSGSGRVRLLLPMISGLPELIETRCLLQEAREALEREGLTHAVSLPVGVMVEIPSAALCAAQLAESADFFSIGTNDLVQYALAADRSDRNVAYLYDSTHPAVARLIAMTLESAAARGIPVSVCGEMASDPKGLALLLGLGARTFSLNALNAPLVRRLVRALPRREAAEVAQRVLRQDHEGSSSAFLGAWLREILGEGFPLA
ncbi:MAG: hypothetical protein HQL51_10355, partial [Magnetococcales bacterium]|nr:hypothetical protein [Magnetococcales bacterium]